MIPRERSESFKMMDVDRALDTLGALRRLSPDLLQFFVIQPNYSEHQRRFFDSTIRTKLDETRLELDFSPSRQSM